MVYIDINIDNSLNKNLKSPLKHERPKLQMAEDLLSRLRSKEDFYRYMTQQGKSCIVNPTLT